MATIDLDPTAGVFDPAGLQRILDGRYADLRAQIREVMSRPEFDLHAAVLARGLSRDRDGVGAAAGPGGSDRAGVSGRVRR